MKVSLFTLLLLTLVALADAIGRREFGRARAVAGLAILQGLSDPLLRRQRPRPNARTAKIASMSCLLA